MSKHWGEWRRSTFSQQGNSCVETRRGHGEIEVRESDNPGVVMRTTPDNWQAFTAGMKAGEFDHLLEEVQ